MDLQSRCPGIKNTCRHPEEDADVSFTDNPVTHKDEGTGTSEQSALYLRGEFDDPVTYPFGTRSFSSEESALEELFQAKTAQLNKESSGLTSSSRLSCVTQETALNSSLARESPPLQVMDRGVGCDLERISSSMFERSGSGTLQEWSVASNESLFSLKIGNASFTGDHDIMFGGVQHKSEEGEELGELIRLTPPSKTNMVEAKDHKAVDDRKPKTAQVDDSIKDRVKEARVETKEERFYTPTTSLESSRVSNQSDGCTTSTISTLKCSWPFCCFTRPSCNWGSSCCKMPRSGCSDCSCSFCSDCSCCFSRKSYCGSNGLGEFCSNLRCTSLCCCSGKTCSSCSLKSLCCCSGKTCSSCSLKALCCCSGKTCSSRSLKSLCSCSGKTCCSRSCSLKSWCCCTGKTFSLGSCNNCHCDMKQLCGCWKSSCCRNKSCSSNCCG